MSQKNSYPDVIVNAFKSVQAWKSLSLILIGVLIFETISIMWLASQRTILLVPQQLSNSRNPISLTLGEPFSPDYLTSIAKGDIFALLNWTPENIDQQYGIFLSRLTPALHSAQKETLLNEAKQHGDEGLTQSFYITRSGVKESTVTLSGVLVRAAGGREVFRGPVTYALTYANAGNGLVMVSSVVQPTPDSEKKQQQQQQQQ